jgi:uncharacterized NAD(P)/FAD-binding protein YdhS
MGCSSARDDRATGHLHRRPGEPPPSHPRFGRREAIQKPGGIPSGPTYTGMLLATGQMKVIAGRLAGFTPGGSKPMLQPVLHVRRRGQNHVIQLPAGAVINCTGPYWDVENPQNPLVANLLASGMVRWDEIGAGFAVTPDSIPRDAKGRATEGLFAVGPICRGTLLEIMVVRDIRTQCAALATRLLAQEKANMAAA